MSAASKMRLTGRPTPWAALASASGDAEMGMRLPSRILTPVSSRRHHDSERPERRAASALDRPLCSRACWRSWPGSHWSWVVMLLAYQSGALVPDFTLASTV
nr:MAG TPA: hypothetical protein [Caudoviricetes sp.]